jgi:3-hydroxyacyl-CoA dehydrogenase
MAEAASSENKVSVEHRGGVAIVTIDNPPVNALSFSVRKPLHDTLVRLRDDAATAAIVLTCAGRTFIAGADITEFGKPMQDPDLRALIALLEAIEKPTVAAIHGTALGGGLELALGCHFRVADKAAKLGLPEVKLGLLPGAGGTVRLPALVGPLKALDMITSGTPIAASEALEAGLVDTLATDGLVADAAAFAAVKAAEGGPFVAVRSRRDKIDAADREQLEVRIKAVVAKAKGLRAPVACTEAVRNAMLLPFDEALAAERVLFVELVASDQSRAQRHLFFAEREAAKVEGVDKSVKPRAIRRIGIIGAGTMGGGIAMAFANGGIAVTLVEAAQEALQRGLERIEKNYAISVSRGSLSEAAKAARMALLSGTTDYAALADCDLIIEAVFEDMAVKKEVLASIDKVAKPGTIIATNTSYLDVNALAASVSRPQDFAGMHFFSPANIMKLLEIVRGTETSADVLVTLLSLARSIGKVPVVVGVCHGFVGNRMLTARGADVEALLLEGASPADVDKAFTDFGWPMGPFQMWDLAGLDISWRNRKALGKTALIADWLCEQGRFGQKTGRGFYLYADGRTAQPDPELAIHIADEAKRLGIAPRVISAEEIIERTLYPLINEGSRILEEGIAARESDVDLVWVNGYGFPLGKGGPMFWARQKGLSGIVDRLSHWHEKTGKDVFKPSDWLKAAEMSAR